MISVVIGLGSNYGNRETNVKTAIEWLKTILMEVKVSEIYKTPCALNSDKQYVNAVVSGFYEGPGFQLDDIFKEKEHEMGRDSKARQRGDVPIDMDIVILNNEVIKDWDYRQKFFRIGYSQL